MWPTNDKPDEDEAADQQCLGGRSGERLGPGANYQRATEGKGGSDGENQTRKDVTAAWPVEQGAWGADPS